MFHDEIEYKQVNCDAFTKVDYIAVLKRLAEEHPNQYVEVGPYTFFVSHLTDALIKMLRN